MPGPGPAPPPTLVDLQIDVRGGAVDAEFGRTAQLDARATLSDGSTAVVTSAATWTSQTPAVAIMTVTTAGLVTFVAGGTATIRATHQGRVAERSFEVKGRPVFVIADLSHIEVIEDCDGITSGRGEFAFYVEVRVPGDVLEWRPTRELGNGESVLWPQGPHRFDDVREEPGVTIVVMFEATEFDGDPDPRMSHRRATVTFNWTAGGGWSPAAGPARQITLGSSGCTVRLYYAIDVTMR
jgi:hypothetical protein